jgi:hypothetical protein
VSREDEIRDPRTFRWVETGVSGLARPREWDATALADVPALVGAEEAELEFRVLADGSVLGPVPHEAVAPLTRELPLTPPYLVRAVRRGDAKWAVAALRLDSEPIELPAEISASSLEVAVPPDGERSVLLDGEIVSGPPGEPYAAAVEELTRRGRARFQAFVARADRVGKDRWELTVDPL